MPTDRDLIAEARAKLAAAHLISAVHDDSTVVVGVQLHGDYRHVNAELMAWGADNLALILDRWESDSSLLRHLEWLLGEVARHLDITNGDDEAILPRLALLKAAGGVR